MKRETLKTILNHLTNGVSKDATRFHLCHVKIERGPKDTLKIESTDGYKLNQNVLTDPHSDKLPKLFFILDCKDNTKALKTILKQRKVTDFRVELDGYYFKVTTPDGNDSVTLVIDTRDINYPNLEPLFPAERSSDFTFAFNAAYLLAMVETMQDNSQKLNAGVRLTIDTKNPRGPISVKVMSPSGEAVGVLMPMKV